MLKLLEACWIETDECEHSGGRAWHAAFVCVCVYVCVCKGERERERAEEMRVCVCERGQKR